MALTRKIVLEATAAEVWHAVATGPGLSSWYVPHELETRKGGIGRADFGGGTIVEGRVLEYEPGKRIVLGGEAIPTEVGGKPEKVTDSPTLEFWLAEEGDDVPDGPFRGIGDVRGRRRRPGSPRTILRFRQRGFPIEDQEVYEAGWDVYFFNLTEYFKHFRGKTALTTVGLAMPQPTSPRERFDLLTKSFGLNGDGPDEGDEVRLKPRGLDPIDGVVDLRVSHPHLEVLGIRNDRGLLRAMADEQCGGAVSRYDMVSNPPRDFARMRDSAANDLQKFVQGVFA